MGRGWGRCVEVWVVNLPQAVFTIDITKLSAGGVLIRRSFVLECLGSIFMMAQIPNLLLNSLPSS